MLRVFFGSVLHLFARMVRISLEIGLENLVSGLESLEVGLESSDWNPVRTGMLMGDYRE